MKRILLYILLLFPCTMLHAQTVTNVDARQDGQNIVITFNMDKSADVTLYYSTSGRYGSYKLIENRYLIKHRISSTEYRYTWNVLGQCGDFIFNNVVFKIEANGINAINGALSGVFSISPTKKIQFSQGNLQYQASTNTWRFAEKQWDFVGTRTSTYGGQPGGTIEGSDNANISETYDGWIDLFGWGTSGWNSGANAYQPYSTSTSSSDYHPGGSYFNNLTGSYAKADWGIYNKIFNGGNQVAMWRTLTHDEWRYLVKSRANASSKLGLATVNNVDGVILLPDQWTLPIGLTFISGFASFDSKSFKTVNNYSTEEWSKMESSGAVFLPAAGRRFGTKVYQAYGPEGDYWSSSAYDGNQSPTSVYNSENAYELSINGSRVTAYSFRGRAIGLSVRLVKDVN